MQASEVWVIILLVFLDWTSMLFIVSTWFSPSSWYLFATVCFVVGPCTKLTSVFAAIDSVIGLTCDSSVVHTVRLVSLNTAGFDIALLGCRRWRRMLSCTAIFALLICTR